MLIQLFSSISVNSGFQNIHTRFQRIIVNYLLLQKPWKNLEEVESI